MTVTLPIDDEEDAHRSPAANISVPRCMTCGGRVANGRCKWANDANDVELGFLDVELQWLLVQLLDSTKVSFPITKMMQANRA
jgi:hypothetical protein